MNQVHIEKNIVARKRKARRRKNHLRRLQRAYDRLFNDYCRVVRNIKPFKKKWYEFWK